MIPDKVIGILGCCLILAFAFLISNNRKAINYRLVVSGLFLQIGLAVFVLKVPFGQQLFAWLGDGIASLLAFSDVGAGFVFGPLAKNSESWLKAFGPGSDYIFAFRAVPTIIFVASLVSIAYYLGVMQKVVQLVAKSVAFLMGASGSEALSNAASIFVGQVEAQLLIKPYVPSMTMSELLASMSGSMACVAGSVLAAYVGFGIKASYLLTASIMAAPGALVIAKIVWPESEESQTKGKVQLEVKSDSVNLIDAAANGAADGLSIGLKVVAVLIAFIALIAMCDAFLSWSGRQLAHAGLNTQEFGFDLSNLKLKDIFGALLAPVAWVLGVPWQEAHTVGLLMGEKLVINEFVAFADLAQILKGSGQHLSERAEIIASFALCGFANFGSIAIQIGGIGEMAPTRRHDLAKLGLKALVCGSLASYMSAALAGMLS